MKRFTLLVLLPCYLLTLGAAARSAPAPADADAMRGAALPSKILVMKSPIDGALGEVLVKENHPFKTRQVIGMMDDAMQKAVLENATLEVETRRLALDDAQIELDKMEELAKRDAAKDWEVRKARVRRDAAEVARKQAAANALLESIKLKKYELKAEFNGVMIRQAQPAGANLRIGDEIFTLVQLDPLEAKLYLPVELYGKLQTGKTYKLQAGQPVNRPLDAELKTFEPVIDAASQTFRATFIIPNPDLALPSGFIVKLPPID
jgi:RND family efflux transporter MFP subunit